MERIKILMVLGNTGRGGSQAYAMNILRNIDRDRFLIDFVVNYQEENDYSDEIASLGGKIFILPYFKVYNYFSYVHSWNDFLSKHHYDIVHGHSTNSAVLYLRIAKAHGCVTIAHSHSAGYRGNWFQQMAKKAFAKGAGKYADYWFACSDKAAERLFGNNYISNPHYYSLPNAVNTDSYLYDWKVRSRIRKELGLSDHVRVYGHVGSFSAPKNHRFLLSVFREIIRIERDSKLICCGDGDLMNDVKKIIAEFGLANNVILTGNVLNVNEYLMAMDCLIFPSLFEGFPITLIEAQATGLPSLISDAITKEVEVTDLVNRMSLSESPSLWAKKAGSLPSPTNRGSYNTIISNTPFNMSTSIQSMMSLYENMYNSTAVRRNFTIT